MLGSEVCQINIRDVLYFIVSGTADIFQSASPLQLVSFCQLLLGDMRWISFAIVLDVSAPLNPVNAIGAPRPQLLQVRRELE